MLCKKGALKKFRKIHRKAPVTESLAQVFFSAFCGIFKGIVNLFSYEKKWLFLHKNTDYTIPCKKSYFFSSIHFLFSSTTCFCFTLDLYFLFCVCVLFFLMVSCLHKKFQTNNSIMYGWKLEKVSDFTVKLRSFCFFSISF